MYASWLLNKVECNCKITKKETSTMVFTLHKFTLYLLTNKFVFYVDHMVVVYLMNKTHVSRWILKWLLFLEYDLL
jgi:hypothetical protein